MMNKRIKSLFAPLRSTKLTDGERKRGREGLIRFMEENPAGEVEAKSEKSSIWSSLFTFRPMPVLAGMLIFVIGGGSFVTYAASDAQPGDFLYRVKVEFNEEVVSLLTFSEEGKLEWELERAEKRVEELASTDDLEDQDIEQLEEYLEESVTKIQVWIDEIEEEDSASAKEWNDEFEELMTVHEVKLYEFDDDEDTGEGGLDEEGDSGDAEEGDDDGDGRTSITDIKQVGDEESEGDDDDGDDENTTQTSSNFYEDTTKIPAEYELEELEDEKEVETGSEAGSETGSEAGSETSNISGSRTNLNDVGGSGTGLVDSN